MPNRAGKSYPKARSIAFSGRSSVPLARHSQRTGIPRPHPWLFMGVQACRLPALKRSKPLKPLKGHFNGFLWASSAGKSPHPWLFMGVQACRLPALKRSKPLKPLKGHFNGFLWASNAGKSPHPWLFMGVQACRLPALKRSKPLKPLKGHFNGFLWARSIAFSGFLWASSAGKSYPKARSIAFSGRSSVPLARHSQRTGIPRPHPWLFMGVQACRLPALKRSKPLKPLKGHFNGFLCASNAGKSPHPLLFMGVQACRLPALKRSKPLKPLKGHFNGFLWASSAGKSYPKARSIAVSGRSRVPFARHSQPTGIPRPLQWLLMDFQRRQKLPQSHAFSGRSSVPLARHSQRTGIPRPHPWLFMGVQACRLPALKRSKPLKPLKGHFNGFLWASSAGKSYPKAMLFLGGPACRSPGIRSQRASQGHIHGFLWASKLAVCQP